MSGDCGPVVVVDGNSSTRSRVLALLRRAGYSTHEAATAEIARDVLGDERPGLVLVKVELPDGTGYELCHELRNTYGEGLPIILLSGDRTKPPDRVAGLLIGADDYILEPYDTEELIGRIRRAITRSLALRPNAEAPAAFELSPRELDVLRLLAHGRNPDEIAEEFVISRKTVTTHIQRILSKLGVHSRAEAVVIAYRSGLADEDPRRRPDTPVAGDARPARAHAS